MINEKIKNLIEDLNSGKKLSLDDFEYILTNYSKEDFSFIKDTASKIAI